MSRLLFILAFSALVFWPVYSTPAEPLGIKGARSQPCPLTYQTHRADLESLELFGRVGQPVLIKIRLDPPQVPSGFFVTSGVEVLEAPAGQPPEVRPGYPDIQVKCFVPGQYRFEVQVYLI
ncbi:MAG: hypothetical protein AB1896_22705, partial [Thermodesulfobacteriota bacterium]